MAPESLARVRFLLFSRDFFLLSGRKLSGARVNSARTANDKQRRRAVYAFRVEYWGCLAARLRGAPRIPEACWIASQTHSLPAPLCYCCQGGGGPTGVISAPWERSESTRSPDDFFSPTKKLSFPSRRGHATRFRASQREFDRSGIGIRSYVRTKGRRVLAHGSWKALRAFFIT